MTKKLKKKKNLQSDEHKQGESKLISISKMNGAFVEASTHDDIRTLYFKRRVPAKLRS